MQIETDRLILREFHQDDWQAVAAYWSDSRYQRFYAEIEDVGAVVRDLVSRCIAAQEVEPRRTYQLAIVRKDDGRVIGNCGIRINAPEHREANIGYELNPDEWGQGFATEAARAIVRFGFEDLGLHRIWAECNAENTGSVRVLTKLGMQREARFREHKWFKEIWTLSKEQFRS
jgi:ribosomal-protein-alanine N-acetyltransferase